ncbi:LOW QUALITY PROTEIN: inositol 1,4,5-triphosphate receptor associated 2 [Menidia menidia]
MGGEGPPPAPSGSSMAEISLICEENLLDTIFHACDTQRRGRVLVSHIVDYLRHTTSRGSEDRGLEELCSMLDPEQRDVSIDLDTYHAVMREWIDDRRNNGEEAADDITPEDSLRFRDSVSARRSVLLNMTSGSLEAFGGEASRAEFETSELVCCVADLQMSNQRLQEEVRRLKLVVENTEEANQKLAEENEDLHAQARTNQQLAQKEKMLKEEVEEMKATLSCTEEGRARASAHSKDMERENQSLISQIASLQEENFRITMETDGLQRRTQELLELNADLQVQIHSLDAAAAEKDAVLQERSRQLEELESALEEYAALTELLRMEKSRLENQLQMILPDLAGASLSLTGAYRMNQSSSGSLQTELALAQSPLEAASPLDETLDREVLLLLQGPQPEHNALEFRALLGSLKKDFQEESSSLLSSLGHILPGGPAQGLQEDLEARRADWVLVLDRLARYAESLEKDLVRVSGNMRRSRTEVLHLSVRVQEQENQLQRLRTPQDSREASCQTPQEEPGEELDWDEEFALQDFLGGAQNLDQNLDLDLTRTKTWTRTWRGRRSGWCWSRQETGGRHPHPWRNRVQRRRRAGPVQVRSFNQTAQEEAAHSQAVSENPPGAETPAKQSENGPEGQRDPTLTPVDTPAQTGEMVPPSSTFNGPAEPPPLSQSEDQGVISEAGGDPEDQAGMSRHKSRSPSADGAAEESFLLPVVVEEEEAGPDAVSVSDGQSGRGMSSTTSDPSSEPKRDRAPSDSNQKEPELKSRMEAGDLPGGSQGEPETAAPPPEGAHAKEDRSSLSPNDKEIEAEFQRLALGFKCDMFTLEKRLRLEERSRDLAEENVRREVSSCQGLLQALTPLCEDDSQSMEIIQRLQKNLEILIQSMTRVSSRSEMLGAIHQENRIGKAVEVMIQHVENLRRTYTTEHAELLELREALMQNERSFGSQTEKDDYRGKKLPSPYYKAQSRRLSLGPVSRSGGSNAPFDLAKPQDGSEAEAERLTRRSPWTVAGRSPARPPLTRFVSSAAWVGGEEPPVTTKGRSASSSDLPPDPDPREPPEDRRRSSLSELGSRLSALILPLKTPSPSPSPTPAEPGAPPPSLAPAPRGSRGLWLWLALLLVLAGLLALLASLVMQPAVDAAPTGPGDSWTTIQQLLWPYAGLRHNGQPPV